MIVAGSDTLNVRPRVGGSRFSHTSLTVTRSFSGYGVTMLKVFSDPSPGVARSAALVAAAVMVVFAVLQTYRASGGSWGLNAVSGGEYDHLPGNLRVASAFSAVVFIAGTFILRGRVGYRVPSIIPAPALRWGTWAFVALPGLSTVANLASSSNWERFRNAPIALLVALLCLVVARSARRWETNP